MSRNPMTQTCKAILIGLAILVVIVFGVIVVGVMFSGQSEEEAVFNELNRQALNQLSRGNYSDAERLQSRALTMAEKAPGKDHPDVLTERNNKDFSYPCSFLPGSIRPTAITQQLNWCTSGLCPY